ncbi:jg16104 [Pararge aegeria aegeria]|uniref:Jg16104 protein n=1 Tax=Pararge aegeria aegeria TaxID=348720 RepID=A0A8S4S2J8_9NEOP|nr:jg16104 [Pararge aegeria aegeria]
MRWTDQVKATIEPPLHERARKATVREEWRSIVNELQHPDDDQDQSVKTVTTKKTRARVASQNTGQVSISGLHTLLRILWRTVRHSGFLTMFFFLYRFFIINIKLSGLLKNTGLFLE